MAKVTTRSFKIPKDLEIKMNKKIVTDGYGMRGKSRWICDAITLFLSSDESFCLDCIEYADELEQLNKSVSFRPTLTADSMLKEWVVKARKKFPTLEGVKSKIIRASILQGILSNQLKNATG